MTTQRLAACASLAAALFALPLTGCGRETPGTVTPAPIGPTAPMTFIQVAASVSPDDSTARWSDIKDVDYDMRAAFFAGLRHLQGRVDAEVREMIAKRAAIQDTINTVDMDFAMKELMDSQAYLKDMGQEAGEANRETWDQEKDKVGQAWRRAQAAYDKVKTSIVG